MSQQRQLGFEHRPFGAGDPKGDSWSEKMNVWSTLVIANEERDRRLHWDASQEEGSLWRASLRILPKPDPRRREHWGREVAYTGDRFRTKRDAKEDACRFLLEEQRRLGRLPDLTTPTPLRGQVAHAPGQGVAAQPPPGGGAGLAGFVRPRPQTVAPIAKAPPPAIVPMPGLQRDAPLPSPAAGQDPGADRQPQEGGAEAPAEGQGGVGPSGTGLAAGDPGSDEPGALTDRLLLSGAPSPSPSSPPREQASSPPQEQAEGDFCASDSNSTTDVEDDEGVWAASEAFREQDDEAKAALAAEELAAAAKVPVPEESEGGMASGSSAGAQGWLGGPNLDIPGGSSGVREITISPDKRSAGPGGGSPDDGIGPPAGAPCTAGGPGRAHPHPHPEAGGCPA